MDRSFLNYQFFKSFRMPLFEKDKVKLKVTHYLQENIPYHFDAKIHDINLFGMNMMSKKKLVEGDELDLYIYTKRIFNNWDFKVKGIVVRTFIDVQDSERIVYGIKFYPQKNDSELRYFLKDFINRFSKGRLHEHLIKTASSESGLSAQEGVELQSLLICLFLDSIKAPLEDALTSVCQVINAECARAYTLKPGSSKLQNIFSTDGKIKKDQDYRQDYTGVAFNSGELINFDLTKSKRFSKGTNETKTVLAYPLFNSEKKTVGVIEFVNKIGLQRFTFHDELSIRLTSTIISHQFERMRAQSSSNNKGHDEFSQADALLYLGKSSEAVKVRRTINGLKNSNDSLLIIGESGTGKEFIAKSIHTEGHNANNSFLSFDLSNKEFFKEQMKCEFAKFELDSKGTIFLKNIDKISLFEQKIFYEHITFSKKRFISCSDKDLSFLVEHGQFLKKLYFFLNHTYIHLRPLRNRKEDLVPICHYFIKKECLERNIEIKTLSKKTISQIKEYSWPKNLNELSRTIKKAFLKGANGQELELEIPASSPLLINDKKDQLFEFIKNLVDQSDKSVSLERRRQYLEVLFQAKKSA